jgi:ABC-type nitrate/sulfonate/bicarbonate transport system permease component
MASGQVSEASRQRVGEFRQVARRLSWLGRWLVLAVGAFAWQGWAEWRASTYFPPPSAILASMYHSWFSGPAAHLYLTPTAISNVLPSLGRVGIALAIAVVIGAPLGIVIGRSPTASDFLEPLMHFGRSLPPVALVPVFIAAFKLGDQMEIAFIAFGTVWPILVNTIDGARSIDPLQLESARALRLPAFQRITQLIVPATMPKFFAGLRISISLSLILMVIAEFTGSSNGIGYLMNQASNTYNIVGLWGGIVLLSILGYLLNASVLGLEHHLLAWHRGARRLTRN